ncbi:MAG: hypothetical protein ACI38Z_00965 [Parafannyhessea sp.]|uniref:hypothetical protein n=1 Tax=Parafannyhessea sp. TaxID=2847324 RepID=UPI003F0BE051
MARKSRVSVRDVAEVLSAGRNSERRRSTPVSLLVIVDSRAPREVVLAVRDAFVPEQESSSVEVRPLAGCGVPDGSRDLVVVVAGPEADAASRVAEGYARCGVATCVVVESALDFVAGDLPESVAALVTPVAASSADALSANLSQWVADVAGEKAIAFAANFPFCREPVVRSLVRDAALQNAAVGAVDVIHGADFPIMTVRQAKLALDIAAANGRRVDLSCVADVAGVAGAGLAYRAVARGLEAALPLPRWMVRSAVGYAGTVATAAVAGVRNQPGLVEGVAERVRAAVGRGADQVAFGHEEEVSREARRLPKALLGSAADAGSEEPGDSSGYIVIGEA